MNYKRILLLVSLTISLLVFGADYTEASNTVTETVKETIEETTEETINETKEEIIKSVDETVLETIKESNNETITETTEESIKETVVETVLEEADSFETVQESLLETNTSETSNETNTPETSKIQTRSLYFSTRSAIIKGWNFDGTNWKYYDTSGNSITSKWVWAPILDADGNNTGKYNWKYFNYQGNNINQFYNENGMTWLSQVGPTKEYVRGWWTNPDSGYKYYFRLSSGTRVSGRQFIDGNWRFFRTTGTLATGRQYVNGGWMYFRATSGTQAFGWQYYDGSWRYNDPKNIGHEYTSVWKFMPISGQTNSSSWKYFNTKGENIFQIYSENGRSYLSQPGPNTGYGKGWWTNPATNQNYYFRSSTGTMVTRWQYIDGMWRFFRNSGTQAFGLQYVNGQNVYLKPETGEHGLGQQYVDGQLIEFGKYYDYSIERYVDSNGQVSDLLSDTGVLNPFILVIDPGHGAGIEHNRGGLLFNEGDQNYYFSQKIIKEAERYQNIIVKTTRPNITDYPSFEERASAGVGADLFASIHTNASDSYVRGVEIWGSQNNSQVGHDFAKDIVNTWSSILNTPNRGVMYDYRDENQVLRAVYYPDSSKEDTWFIYQENTAKEKILLESVFHTNFEDSRVFLNNQDTLAREFMDKVAKHFGLKLK